MVLEIKSLISWFRFTSGVLSLFFIFLPPFYTNFGTVPLIANTNSDGQDGGHNYVRMVFDDNGELVNLSNDKILSTTIGNKRYYYFNLFDSSNPPPDGLNTVSGGQLGGTVDRLGFTDPNQMVFIVGEELTVEPQNDITGTSTSAWSDNITGDGSTRVFTLSNAPVVPGSLSTSIDFGSGPVSLTDDGTGNIVDASNNIYGKIDYTTGTVEFFNPPVSGAYTIAYSYGSYDGDNANEDVIANSYVNQYASDFIITAEQDGYSKGDLIDVYVLSEDGSVVGVYSNGKSLPLYRVALAVFADPDELTKKGANLYTSITTPTIMTPGGSEKIRSGMLEMSNVDIAKEFISLITAQRAYQANARVITTANTVLDETVNLVR